MPSPCPEEWSRDTLFDGRVVCLQPRQGYRFSIDAVLLAHFCEPAPFERVLDLGSGCGVLSLILAFRHPNVSLVAVEIQEELCRLCRENVARNGLEGRIRVLCGDARDPALLPQGEPFDQVVVNPPFYPAGSGRLSQNPQAALARHEINLDLASMVMTAQRVLHTQGRLSVVYPATRLASLIAALREKGLEPKRLRLVHSYPGDVARLALLEAVKNGGESLSVLPPLFIYQAPGGGYTEEVASFYR